MLSDEQKRKIIQTSFKLLTTLAPWLCPRPQMEQATSKHLCSMTLSRVVSLALQYINRLGFWGLRNSL